MERLPGEDEKHARSLRSQLILSHLLPLLLVVPLATLALTYLIETQVLLVNLSQSLTEQAELIAEAADAEPGLWRDPDTAQIYLTRMTGRVPTRIMLLQPSGYVLAASSERDHRHIGDYLEHPALVQVQRGEAVVYTAVSLSREGEFADVMVPVMGESEEVVGIVRATNQLATVSTRFWRLRQLVLATVLVELLVGAAVGLVLALRLERPLRAATETVDRIAAGREPEQAAPDRLREEGPQEIRRLLEAVNRLAARLQLAEEARQRLLANVVHELGRPLGAVRSAVHALRTGAADEVALREELLAGVDGELRTLQALLDDLAQLHEQLLRPAVLERQPTPLDEWLAGLLPPWRQQAREKGLQWESQVPADLPELAIDPVRLSQAVGNLLSNAIKYSEAGDTVRVSAGQSADEVWISVADTGPGIPAEEQEQIFEPFIRGRQRERFAQGLGLGLTITRDLVSAHGGHLTLTSKAGEGSRFTIHLPFSSTT